MTAPRVNLVPVDATSVAPPMGLVPGSIEEARRQMALLGITQEQHMKGYTGRVSEALYNAVKPVSYEGHGMQLVDAVAQMIHPTVSDKANNDGFFTHPKRRGDEEPGTGGFTTPSREDSWRLYLGLPQQHNTFGISAFQPANSKEKKTYFSLPELSNIMPGTINDLVDKLKDKPNKSTYEYDFGGPLGHYKLSLGKDDLGHYISYYDKWDLDKSGANLAGHPYEVYDRVYYNPKTYERIPEDQVLSKKGTLDLKPEDHSWIQSALGQK